MSYKPQIVTKSKNIELEKAIKAHPIEVSNSVVHWIAKEIMPRDEFDTFVSRLDSVTEDDVDRIIEKNLKINRTEVDFVKKEIRNIKKPTI